MGGATDGSGYSGFAAVIVNQQSNCNQHTNQADDGPLGRIGHKTALNDTDALKKPNGSHQGDQYGDDVNPKFHDLFSRI